MNNPQTSEKDYLVLEIPGYGTAEDAHGTLQKLIEDTNDFLTHIISFLSKDDLKVLLETSRGFKTLVMHYQRPWYNARNHLINLNRFKIWDENKQKYQQAMAIVVREENKNDPTCAFMLGSSIPLIIAVIGWINYLYPEYKDPSPKKIMLAVAIAATIITVVLCIAPFVINFAKLISNEQKKKEMLRDKPEFLRNLTEDESFKLLNSYSGKFFKFKHPAQTLNQKKRNPCTIL